MELKYDTVETASLGAMDAVAEATSLEAQVKALGAENQQLLLEMRDTEIELNAEIVDHAATAQARNRVERVLVAAMSGFARVEIPGIDLSDLTEAEAEEVFMAAIERLREGQKRAMKKAAAVEVLPQLPGPADASYEATFPASFNAYMEDK